MSEELTAKQRLFVERLAQGDAQAVAYRKAFSCSGKSDASICSAASRLAKNVKVLAYRKELEEESRSAACLSREEKLELLADLARCDELSPVERMKAIEIDNKMQGHNEPEKVEIAHDMSGDLMSAVLLLQREEEG